MKGYDFSDPVRSAYFMTGGRARNRMLLAKEIERLHKLVSEIHEVASGAALRWNESLTEPERLRMIDKLCLETLERLFAEYGV
jgi:hypothetical protein